ncbi:hypothetical protein BLOT_015466 [Blomia tropicalis]|nr:hypothetical protein BLOT_015466 [Blomia tropicalis]
MNNDKSSKLSWVKRRFTGVNDKVVRYYCCIQLIPDLVSKIVSDLNQAIFFSSTDRHDIYMCSLRQIENYKLQL